MVNTVKVSTSIGVLTHNKIQNDRYLHYNLIFIILRYLHYLHNPFLKKTIDTSYLKTLNYKQMLPKIITL